MNDATFEEKLAARELRTVCYHEASHAVAARMFGGFGQIEVWSNDPALVAGGERAWRGRFRLYAKPGDVALSEDDRRQLGILAPPENWRVIVGLAGLVGESMLDGERDEDSVACDIDNAIALEEASATDAEMFEGWDVFDVACTIALLDENWEEVEREAGWLAETAL